MRFTHYILLPKRAQPSGLDRYRNAVPYWRLHGADAMGRRYRLHQLTLIVALIVTIAVAIMLMD